MFGLLHYRCYENKGLRKSKSDNHEGFHHDNRIGVCDDENIIQKYVDDVVVGFYNDHKGIK